MIFVKQTFSGGGYSSYCSLDKIKVNHIRFLFLSHLRKKVNEYV